MENKNKIIYLSGAPRVSTSIDSENTAARNHILEVCQSFENLNYEVSKYILGDTLPNKMTQEGSEKMANKSVFNRILADIFRLLLIVWNRKKAMKVFDPKASLVYERFALMQSVGWAFKRRGIFWILETNAILSEEAYYESKTLYLKRISEWLESWAYQKCDLLVTISDSLKNSIIAKYGVDANKIYVMQNGVNTKKFHSKSLKPQDSFVIGYVGSVIKWQRLDLLIEAVSKVENHDSLRVKIVGDGSELTALKKLAKDLSVADIVEFVGRVSPEVVPSEIESFSIGYCNPQHDSEGSSEVFNSPMKLYEYLAMSKPVIAQNNYDLSQLGNSTNYLHTLQDYKVESLMSGIMHFYENKEKLIEWGDLARDEIVANHSWDGRVKNLLDKVNVLSN